MIDRETYLLICLSEEASEIIHRASKAIRFGLDEVQPGQASSNRERLCDELSDLLAVVSMLNEEAKLAFEQDQKKEEAKRVRVDHYFGLRSKRE
jgi:NTP pyrophosphatase (non-canonical NTP hydrolase)